MLTWSDRVLCRVLGAERIIDGEPLPSTVLHWRREAALAEDRLRAAWTAFQGAASPEAVDRACGLLAAAAGQLLAAEAMAREDGVSLPSWHPDVREALDRLTPEYRCGVAG